MDSPNIKVLGIKYRPSKENPNIWRPKHRPLDWPLDYRPPMLIHSQGIWKVSYPGAQGTTPEEALASWYRLVASREAQEGLAKLKLATDLLRRAGGG